jgi:hypothetical protein
MASQTDGAAHDDYGHIALALLRDKLTDQLHARLNALHAGDWPEIIQAADRLGVAPLLFSGIRRLRLDVPAAVSEQLHKILTDNTARNLRFLAEFDGLAAALQAEDIPFMPLKGVYLCSNLYENIGERPIWDIDLIVHKPHLMRAVQAIEGAGYRASRPYDLELECRNYHHLPVYLKAGAAPVEIHWTLLNPRFRHSLDLKEAWGRSIPARVGGATVQVLSAGDLLIYLCAHVAYQHVYMDAVRALYDIKLVVQRFADDLGWDAIARRARAWDLLNSVYLSLRLTAETLGSPLPESTWQALRPDVFSERLVQAGLTRILENTDTSPVMNAVWAKQNALQRLKGLWDRIFVPPSILAGRYGLPPDSRRVYLFYFVRLRDLLRIHGRNLLDLWLGGKQKTDRARRDGELVAYLGWWQ